MRRHTPLPLYETVHILDEPPPFLQLRTYLMNGLFLNQKKQQHPNIIFTEI